MIKLFSANLANPMKAMQEHLVRSWEYFKAKLKRIRSAATDVGNEPQPDTHTDDRYVEGQMDNQITASQDVEKPTALWRYCGLDVDTAQLEEDIKMLDSIVPNAARISSCESTTASGLRSGMRTLSPLESSSESPPANRETTQTDLTREKGRSVENTPPVQSTPRMRAIPTVGQEQPEARKCADVGSADPARYDVVRTEFKQLPARQRRDGNRRARHHRTYSGLIQPSVSQHVRSNSDSPWRPMMEGGRQMYTPTLSQQIYLQATMSRERAAMAQELIDDVKKSPSYRYYRSRYPPGHRFEVKTPRNIIIDNMDAGMELQVVESWQRTVEAKSKGVCLLNMINPTGP